MESPCSTLQASTWPEHVQINHIVDAVREHDGDLVFMLNRVWIVVPEGVLREEAIKKLVPAMYMQLEEAARVRFLSLLPTPDTPMLLKALKHEFLGWTSGPGETATALAQLTPSLPSLLPVADALTEKMAAQDITSINQTIAFTTPRAVFAQPALAMPGGAADLCVKEVLADFSTAPQDDKEVLVLFLKPIPDWRETVGLEPRTVDYLQAVLRRENLHLINKRDEEMLERVKTETRCLHDDSSAITARLAGMRLSTQKAEGGEGQEQRREALRVAVAEKQAEVAAKQDAIEELQSTLLLPLPPLAMPPDTEGESEAEELARAVGPLRKRDEALRDRIQGLRKEWDELNAAIPSLKGTISEASARTQALLPVHAKVAKEVEQKEAELAKAQEALKRYANTASNVVLQRARDKEER